jgi:hypothetical protein
VARRNRTKHNKKRREADRQVWWKRWWGHRNLMNSIDDWDKAMENRDTPFITHIKRDRL